MRFETGWGCPAAASGTLMRGGRAALGAVIATLVAVPAAMAQAVVPPSTQFDVVGLIQEAVLDPACQANPHCGGTIKVNGHVIVVPKEIVVILPANALTWQELFAQAPLPYGLAAAPVPASGMALADLPAPLTAYEAHVIGNRVLGGPAGADLYIAAMIFASQESLNNGAGYINFIDYAAGELRVGGVVGDSTTGARVRINDPVGRYGRASSPDVRFTVDSDNPTVMAGTGYPMCLPRTDPAVADDPLCPQAQRPVVAAGPPVVFQMSIQTNDPTNRALIGVPPDATKQVPFEIGDYVTYSGTLVTDNAAAPTASPWPGTASTWISAHTIVSNVAVYTWPGTNPAYVMTDVTLMGTGGLAVLGAQEAATRTRFEGMSTDPSRNVHLYGIDTAAVTGAVTDRDWGTIGVDPGPPTGAVKGRWRFRPPCLAYGSVPLKPSKDCVMNQVGTFLPPTREVRAVIEGAWTPPVPPAVSPTAANGLVFGQYHAPILEYIFPENVPGSPIIPNNFSSMPFLLQGGTTTAGGTIVGQLDPWPDITGGCLAPTANAGGPYGVVTDGTVQLAGSATGLAPLSFLWTVSSGSLSSTTAASPIFNAAGAVSPVTATLTVTSNCGSATASTSVVIHAPGAPAVNPVAPISVTSNASIRILLSGTDPNVPAQALTFNVAQSPANALVNLVITSTGPSTATLTANAPNVPVGQQLINLSITATNTSGLVSSPALTSITVLAADDQVVVTAAQYRISRQRLDITATSSRVSPLVSLTLVPYLTTTGTLFDPSPLGSVFTNTGGGIYTLTVVGVPSPALPPATPITVISNLGGVSAPVSITTRN